MLARISAFVLPLLVVGCSTVAPSIPEGYSGPRAVLEDTVEVRSGSKADMFVVEKLNGANIDNSIRQSARASQGRGFSLTSIVASRPVPAGQPIKVGVKGRTVFAAPIQALTSTVYQVVGVVEFVPRADSKYLVRGTFGDDYSAVWIEDAASREVVGSKVEVKGSAELGFFEK